MIKFLLVLLVWPFSSHADLKLAEKAIDQVHENSSDSGGFDESDIFTFNAQAFSGDDEAAVVGLVSFSLIGDAKSIELVWWRSDRSKVREICVALLLQNARGGIKADNVIELIRSSARRFTKKEGDQRIRELEQATNSFPKYKEAFKRLRKIPLKKSE
jgi:hypothetical protein